MSSAAITVRTDDTTKRELAAFAASVGVSINTLSGIILKQAVKERRIVLTPTLEPTAYLENIMREARADRKAGRNVSPVFDDVDTMFEHMEKNADKDQ